MTKRILIFFSFFTVLGLHNVYAQQGRIFPVPDPVPPVINFNHISISGTTLVQQNNIMTYTADYFYPGETSHAQWLVAGGQILNSNTNAAAGPVFVTVKWDFTTFSQPPFPLPRGVLDPNAKGVVALTQGTVFVNKIYQAAYLYVYELQYGPRGYPDGGCTQSPQIQSVNYLQQPCLITGVTDCVTPGVTHIYQWKYYDAILQDWASVTAGGTGVNYQPPSITQASRYSRLTTDANGEFSFDRAGASVDLNVFSPGALYTDNANIDFGQQPTVVDEMPYGGTCQSTAYNISWEVSYNSKPWQVFSTALHFPGLPNGVTKEQVRIRRGSSCGTAPLSYTNILTFGTAITASPSESQNYIRENTMRIKNIESPAEAALLQIGDKIQDTKYFDGLGRQLQSVSKEAGTPDASAPSVWQDIVVPQKYDATGRQPERYLPYPTTTASGFYKPNAFAEQPVFYTAQFNETPSYGQVSLEANPLGRISNTKSAGSAWAASNGNKVEYDVNDHLADDVKIFTVGSATSGALPSITVTGVYNTGDLYKTTYTDEKGVPVVEYRDKTGNLIMKKVSLVAGNTSSYSSGWLCTYNVYDDLDRLRAIITPKATEYLLANNWIINSNGTTFKELCSYFEYDYKGRLAIKKVPQAGSVRYVYDSRDRLVLTQDENQSTGYYTSGTTQWSFNLYDDLDRVKVTGILNSPLSHGNLQMQVDALQVSNTAISVSLGGPSESVTVHTPVTVLGTVAQYNSINYYDHYSYTGSKVFNTGHAIPVSTDPNVEPTTTTSRVANLSTGSKVRVLDNSGKVLINTVYYDDEARVLQTTSDNIKNGEDVKTNQYDFADKILFTSSIHTAQNTGYTNYTVLTKYSFDKIGRITMLSKKFGGATFKDVAAYSYDVFGRMKVKRLGLNPISGGAQMESLEYTYNINGQLTGINKFYAQKDPVRYDKWANFFGLYLGYDNKDGAFARAELNGNITGAMWSTQGDDVQRKYDYHYDLANRLVRAIYAQKDNPTSSWDNTKINFGVGGNFIGKVRYDANGNIMSMFHLGTLPGESPKMIDNLLYTYDNNGYSNRLLRVDDYGAMGTTNGKLGDFKDGANGTGNGIDYTYDENGNLVIDENKGVKNLSGTRGVKYNYLDKVEEINIVGKGVTKFVYDAAGNKLQRIFTPVGGTAKVLTYIDEYVYEGNELQFINFEVGRLRIITQVSLAYKTLSGNFAMPVAPGAPFGTVRQGVFDYFIADHLGSTRMVLTEEQQWAKGICTMELANAPLEEQQFGQLDYNTGSPSSANEVITTRSNVPAAWSSNSYPSGKCALLYDATGKRVGPNSILKVMAGDEITAQAEYYYANNTNSSNSQGLLSSILNSLTGAANGGNVNSTIKANGAQVGTAFSGSIGLVGFINNMGNYGMATAPRAYINIIFLDEQFNYVGSATPDRVSISGGALHQPVKLTGIKVPKNGYAYVFLSNESSEAVYFDDFIVEHTRGRIIEENHYYPFGLKIASISSRKLGDAENGSLQNRYGYQGAFAEEDEETGWNEFILRNYDPQIGRWTGADPYMQYPSPYTGVGNDPVNNIDPDGGWIFSSIPFIEHGAWAIAGTVAGAVIGGATSGWDTKAIRNGALIGGGIGLGASFVNWGAVGNAISNATQWAGSNLKQLFSGSVNEVLMEEHMGEVIGKVTYYLYFEGDASNAEEVTKWGKDDNGNNIPLEKKSTPQQIGTGKVYIKIMNGDKIDPKNDPVAKDENGKDLVFDAVSGPGGNGLLPNGDYDASVLKGTKQLTKVPKSNFYKEENGFKTPHADETGWSFKIDLKPDAATRKLYFRGKLKPRDGIVIHPIPSGYTDGCVGIQGGHAEALRFFFNWQRIISTQKKINLRVNIKGNNNLGIKRYAN